mmetsp:Transcript_23901/g.63246  ORF Transcript_23901/g.63246 Transcript_23901/m.63246 type:complete len:224 (+) Transcript_23901:1818-2489(+)
MHALMTRLRVFHTGVPHHLLLLHLLHHEHVLLSLCMLNNEPVFRVRTNLRPKPSKFRVHIRSLLMQQELRPRVIRVQMCKLLMVVLLEHDMTIGHLLNSVLKLSLLEFIDLVGMVTTLLRKVQRGRSGRARRSGVLKLHHLSQRMVVGQRTVVLVRRESHQRRALHMSVLTKQRRVHVDVAVIKGIHVAKLSKGLRKLVVMETTGRSWGHHLLLISLHHSRRR